MFDDDEAVASRQWWLATVGNLLVWARLTVHESGIARILDSDGRVEVYDSEDSAQAALLDADFRAFDGLDEDDAHELGFSLATITPPDGIDGADPDELRALMTVRLASRH